MCASKPKVPAPTPVIERQPYKNAPSRESLSSGLDRPRQIAGVVTSARGVLEPASTTKRVMMGGDQQINPTLSAPASSGTILTTSPGPSAPAATTGGSLGGQRPRRPVSSGSPFYPIGGQLGGRGRRVA